jgi:hypothetical protein
MGESTMGPIELIFSVLPALAMIALIIYFLIMFDRVVNALIRLVTAIEKIANKYSSERE